MEYEKFIEGECAILDSGFNNSSLVDVLSQTPNRMFSKVRDENSIWEVMTDRLSKIKINDEEI